MGLHIFTEKPLKPKLLLSAVIFFMLTGCSMQKMAGNAVLEYTHDQAVPYLMAQDDLNAACQMGQALGPVVASFSRVELQPENIGIATQMASGMCAEFEQRNAELDRYRALFNNQTTAAQDALIREKNMHRLSARRMFAAYQNAVKTYGDIENHCPKFDNETDALLALLGQASGALALLHDFNSEKSVGIDLEIPVKIEKAAACFDDDQWWGMPTALRAAIWLSIPGSAPKGVEPLDAMQKAAEKGDKQGVILARAMLAMMAATVGQNNVMCNAIAQLPEPSAWNHQFDMLNAYALGLIEHHANIAWTKEKGYRAPFLHHVCPGLAQSASSMDEHTVDELLDDLLDEDSDIPSTPVEQHTADNPTTAEH